MSKKEHKPLSQAQLEKGIEELPPYILEAIKDRTDQIPVYVLEDLVLRRPLPRRIMLKYGIPFNQHQKRQLALEALYQHKLLDKDIRKTLFDVMMGTNDIDGFLYDLTVGTAEHEEEYRDMIRPLLREDWDLERLGLLDQVILEMGCQEILNMDTPRSVAINEAVQLAKEYCDDSTPQMVNGILDRIGK